MKLKELIKVMNASKYLELALKINIDSNVADMINNEASIVNFQAKHIVLLEGIKSKNLYFMISGVVRGYYIDEHGNDITKCFSSENEFFSSEGLRTASISSFTIECLEHCQCIKLPYVLVYKIIKEDENLNNIFIKYYLQEVEKLENRVKNSALMNAEERYINFCKQYPHLHGRVELKYIASYIGIRAASLSRIRKDMKNIFLN
ncbi:Crp/Fnr family transcriptional regulator [Clostridium sporogenes]|uniref:Crp/Fnr family transcriptional regulator n=3 Tax=Clostridium TaxID=1485 RepID=A0AAU8YXX0_CLOBO|nr:Crp/Fnr family transcriptional regulator [Clostridium sporogenes]AVP62430.1 Crp/Fnr family transcriptional regulator [Clostridium botulinum]AVP65371.1 Crp/Fnr family transcriptional regulator [Clostridium botulinum]MBA4508980.1 Crp/Fnr family transcriptional regulator [Clostridium sporogenes]MBY7014060.1 Crp/Fnr family transcriptional regulator [Clostridium sporogenes]MBY7063073.1 Crp/Fnr family transcriptional regulator [Clostridium sporogenes]